MTEMLYAVNVLKNSQGEKRIISIERITELEPGPERPELRAVL